METILVGNYEFLSNQNLCIYKMTWGRINTIARVLNHILLESAGNQHSDEVCGVCITLWELSYGWKCVIHVKLYVNIITYRSISFLIYQLHVYKFHAHYENAGTLPVPMLSNLLL